MPEPDFDLRNVHVSFQRQPVHRGSMQRLLQSLLRRRKRDSHPDHTGALSGITFSIMPGERVGIIGRNGAGKSTLLRVLAGVIHPAVGTVKHNPRRSIAPLLELGIGFMPDLSGRENCFLAGALMGLTQAEVGERMGRILGFAEIDGFEDEPVRTYSSGMHARLGFALATEVEPDILLLDEVLGVGDEFFVGKCVDRIRALITSGCTTVAVSHNADFLVQHSDRLLWLDNGILKQDGPPNDVVAAYRARFGSS